MRIRLLGILRIALAGVLAVQLLLLARGILGGTRFVKTPGSPVAAGFVTALVILAAIAILLNVRRPKSRTIQVLIVGIAVALTVRFHLAAYLHRPKWPGQPRLAAIASPQLSTFLRNLSSAQEQYRLRSGRYSESMDSLRPWTEEPTGSTVRLIVNDALGWSGEASLDGRTCSIWVRDSALRKWKWQAEGHPACGTPERRLDRELVPTVVAAVPPEIRPFADADIAGTWPEHRNDARRTGVAAAEAGKSAHSWNTRLSGPLRAPVSIAGNQVFAGAHGNGELVALTLDSGKLGFRLRAPNWIHHEPAVSNELLVVGFGNNEEIGERMGGSPPTGVVAYDRRTGFERWRFKTRGSVMAVPIISDSVVAATTGAREVVGIRLRDGTELWRTVVADQVPMGNPMLVDNLVIFGIEPKSACAVDIHSGALAYCTELLGLKQKCGNCWGAGHASSALAGDVALQIFQSIHTKRIALLKEQLRRAVGFPRRRVLPESGEQILVAFDWRTGRVRWRTSLGKGSLFPAGHIAGTPTVVDSVAFIPAASNGHVVAVNTRSGRVLWSAPVRSTRGSVSVIRGSVFAATQDTTFVVLDAASGHVKCRQRVPARADRAGLTIAGETGILTLGNGTIMARPLEAWLGCKA